MNISIIIPTYRNVKGLVKNLQKNIPYFAPCEIIVVNDDPKTSIRKDLADFPHIILIENTKNKGFAGTINVGVKKASRAYIMLVNDDVIFHTNSFSALLPNFLQDPNLFAITFLQKERNGIMGGKNTIFWKDGFVQHNRSDTLTSGITAWAEGGSSLIDAAKFRLLQGFDELYAPFYWEDIDLSYRAWKQGFTVLFTDRVVVDHHHETTIGTHFSQEYITSTAYRNQLIFIWKNITSPSLLVSHIGALSIRIIRSILKRDMIFLSGVIKVFLLVPAIILKKINLPTNLSDHEILNKFN